MLQKQTVSIPLLKALETLMQENILKDFRLVGGTALSLQLGHRLSLDIDLFTDNQSIDMLKIESILKTRTIYEFRNVERSGITLVNSLKFFMNDIKIDLCKWPRKFKEPYIAVGNIRMATLNDIANFKLDAISARVNKKDFIDLYFLGEKLGGENFINNYLKQTEKATIKTVIENLQRAQGAFDNKTPMPVMLKPLSSTDEVVNGINLLINKIS